MAGSRARRASASRAHAPAWRLTPPDRPPRSRTARPWPSRGRGCPHDVRGPRAHPVDDVAGVGTVVDEIAQAQDPIEPVKLAVPLKIDGPPGGNVAVNVRDEQRGA